MKIREKIELSAAVWKLAFSALIKKPVIALPLAIAAFIKGIGLTLLYYYPRQPFSVFSAPILNYFQRAHYLHYPANFIFLSKLNNYLSLVTGIIFVSFCSGWMVYLIRMQTMKEEVKPGEGFKKTFSKYLSLAAVWIVVSIIAMAVFKGEGILLRKYFSLHRTFLSLNFKQIAQLAIYINLMLAVIINTVFAFTTPSIVIEGRKFFKSIIRSLGLMKALFLPAFILVLTPSLMMLPVSLLKYNLPGLMMSFFPEVTLFILGLNIVVVFLVDLIVLASVTILFILNKEAER